ncbi:hypothetical protein JCM11641_006409 [Rhodosporidiobolus odoratus]
MSRRPPDSNRDPVARSPSPQASRSGQPQVASNRRRSSAHPPLVAPASGAVASQASLGVPGGGRGPRGSPAVRRSSRRASLDPYPVASSRNTSPEVALRVPAGEGGSRRTSRSRTPARESVQEDEEGRQDAELSEARSLSRERGFQAGLPGSTADMNFRLVMLQQPEIGAEAGRNKNTLGRLPIVPAPVVELIVQDHNGDKVFDREFPFLFCSCSLRKDDGVSAVEVAQRPPSDDGTSEEFSALVGGLVRQSHRIEDMEGNHRDVFVFEDVSVRSKGSYTLEFTLGEAIRPKSPKLAATRSGVFDVVEWQQYPGRPAQDTVPDLSLHLHKQGVPMYIPPLLLSQPSDNPPPPGSNPFPPGAMDDLASSTSAPAALSSSSSSSSAAARHASRER